MQRLVYKIEIFETGVNTPIFEVVKDVGPFVKESKLIKGKYLSSPKYFVLHTAEDQADILKHVSTQLKQWQGFINYVENPQALGDLNTIEADIVRLNAEIETEKGSLNSNYAAQQKEYQERVCAC